MSHQGQLLLQSSPSCSSEKATSFVNATNTIWTDELVGRLKNLHAAKCSGGVIANKLGLTRNQVIGKLFRLGLKGTSAPKHRVTRVHSDKPVNRRPKLKIVAGGGGSMRFIKTSEADLAPLRCAEIEPRHLTFAQLGRGDCRYPYGDRDYTYCGNPVFSSSSYCGAHHQLCWVLR